MARFVVVLLALSCSHAWGSIIVANGAPSGVAAGPISGFVLADDFTLSTPASATGAEFWSIESPITPWDGSLTYFFFTDNSGSPSVTPFAMGSGQQISRVATGLMGTANTVAPQYHWTFSFEQPVALAANQKLWFGLTIGEGAPTGPGVQGHFWEATAAVSGLPVERGTFATPTSFSTWTDLTPQRDTAFNLVSEPVPEPATAIIWAMLVGVGTIPKCWTRSYRS